MRVYQRDIVELLYPIDEFSVLPHPAIVISNEEVVETESYFIAVMITHRLRPEEFSFLLTNDMRTMPSQDDKPSYVKCQTITRFLEGEVRQKFGQIKIEPFRQLIAKINESVFSIKCNP